LDVGLSIAAIFPRKGELERVVFVAQPGIAAKRVASVDSLFYGTSLTVPDSRPRGISLNGRRLPQ
jgi:hypothetical protein